jgi:uncharacterized protein YbjT (DUF2867 family)
MSTTATKPILVTAATGTVGRHVVRGLIETNGSVRAATRDPSAYDAPGDGVEPVRFDFADPSTYGEAFRGCEAMFLVRPPAIAAVWNSIFPAIDAAAEAGIRHIVFLSVQGAAENPLVPHRWIEWKLANAEVTATSLRPSFFMQNLVTTHREEIAREGQLVVPAGTGETAFVDARDVADVAVHLLDQPPAADGAYEITGPAAFSYATATQILSDVLGRRITYVDASVLDFVRYSRAQGRDWAFIFVMTGIYLTARFGLADRTTDTVQHLLNRPPRSFRQFAEDYAGEWGMGNGECRMMNVE